jgi:hypothetical protein
MSMYNYDRRTARQLFPPKAMQEAELAHKEVEEALHKLQAAELRITEAVSVAHREWAAAQHYGGANLEDLKTIFEDVSKYRKEFNTKFQVVRDLRLDELSGLIQHELTLDIT